MFEEKTLTIWTNIYFYSLVAAAIAGAISIAAGFIQNNINSGIQEIMKKNIADANESAAKATLKAAEVENQNIELRQKFANRRITEEQYSVLIKELSGHKSSFNLETMGDTESGLFAADILKTFTNAGWEVDKKEFPLGVIWTGLILFQSKDPALSVISGAFNKANIPFSYGNQCRDKATIMVGGRPPIF